jgi:AraC family transcriptional regulator
MATARELFVGPDLLFAELSLDRDDPDWGDHNHVSRSIVALPAGPVWQAHDGSEPRLFAQNHVVFHRPGTQYRRERFRDMAYRALFLIPSPALLREAAGEVGPVEAELVEHPRSPRSGPLDGRTFAASRVAARWLRANATEPGAARELLYEVLLGAVRATRTRPGAARPGRERTSTARARRELVEETKVRLTDGMAEGVSLDEAARRVHTSAFHLARVFRSETGFSVHGYLTHLRLRTGLDRLQWSEDPGTVGRIGLDVGYATHSHFTASFRRAFGLTPSAVMALDRAGRGAAAN